ncbi:MAG: response regulator transcription factor [Actinomycetes bacterium]
MDVLIVEDDDSIAEPLARGLEREHLHPRRVATGAAALEAVPADVVLLDLGLPDMDGRDVCRRLREVSDVPIIVVSARGEELDRVLLLELGADDYLVKPFGLQELVARIRAVTRRSQGNRRAVTPGVEATPPTVGALAVDRRAHRVTVAGSEVVLTPKEYDLVALLASDPGRVFTRTEIFDEVWDPHWYGPTKTLDVHIASVRRKLGDPGWIETVRGVGFRLVDPSP